MTSRIKAYINRQMFYPGFLGLFVNPFYVARSQLLKGMITMAPYLKGRLLDVGCGTKPYRELFEIDEYVGLDIDDEHTRSRGQADKYYDGKSFPFPDNTFDSVLCTQVLEHVFNPEEFVAELVRVLKPGGKLLLSVPFAWDEHEQPNDYARYTSFGLKSLLERQGFVVVSQLKLADDVSAVFQLANLYLYKVAISLPRAFTILLTVTVMAAFNFTGVLMRWLLPANPDFFLDQMVLAEKTG